jgi:galactose-6-phosphate isomerase
MKVVLAADAEGQALEARIAQYLNACGYEVVEKGVQADCVDAALVVAHELQQDTESRGIVVDAYGAGSFMAACKVKGMVAAEISDERSAYMTRQHNNARMICLGSQIVGEGLALNVVREFLHASYEGGRHQIRIDMLNKMA